MGISADCVQLLLWTEPLKNLKTQPGSPFEYFVSQGIS